MQKEIEAEGEKEKELYPAGISVIELLLRGITIARAHPFGLGCGRRHKRVSMFYYVRPVRRIRTDNRSGQVRSSVSDRSRTDLSPDQRDKMFLTPEK